MSTTLPSNCTFRNNNGHSNNLVQELYCLDHNTKRAQQRARQPSCPHRQREQKLRKLHSFLHCHDPAPSNHLDDVLHDLWHWSTICSASPAITLMMSSMTCGTGTPRSAPPRARDGLQGQGRQQPCRRTARPPRTATEEPPQYPTPPRTRARQTTLSKSCRTAAHPRPALPCTIREPTLGLPGAALDDAIMTVVSLCTGLCGPRVRGSLSRRKRHRTDKSSGQQLPRDCRPSSDSSRCTLQTPEATRNGDPWPAPGFPSQSP